MSFPSTWNIHLYRPRRPPPLLARALPTPMGPLSEVAAISMRARMFRACWFWLSMARTSPILPMAWLKLPRVV